MAIGHVNTEASEIAPLEQINLPDGRGGTIELFMRTPTKQTDAPRPALLIVHGHQFPHRPGARGRLSASKSGRWDERGYMRAAVSQPGYGASTGPADFCGPRTQATLRIAFAHMIERGADPDRTIVWGVSRGAIAASCAFVDGATEPALLILQAGSYDMEARVAWTRAGAPGGDVERVRGILDNIEREAGLDPNALRARSGVAHAHRGRCDVLIVHGSNDPQTPPADRERLASALRGAGRRAELVVLEQAGHVMPASFALEQLATHWPHLAP